MVFTFFSESPGSDLLQIFILTHFCGWNLRSHLSDQLIKLSISCWSRVMSACESISLNILVSSANKYKNVSLSTTHGKSFIYFTKSKGPMTLPCGIPLVTGAVSDNVSLIQTCCVRFAKKDFIHPIYYPLSHTAGFYKGAFHVGPGQKLSWNLSRPHQVYQPGQIFWSICLEHEAFVMLWTVH